ncbi:MAG: ABC transporter permease [Stellaceae bacterium]
MTAPAEPAAGAVSRRIAIHNPVLLVVMLVAATAITSSGFLMLAANRLVAGRPIALWAAARPAPTIAIVVIGALLLAASLLPPTRAVHAIVAVLAGFLLLSSLATLGLASREIAATASRAARVSPGAAFWFVAAAAALALIDALQRLDAGPPLRLLAMLAIGTGILGLAAAGSFDALSIAREYAARRQLFAEALVRHIALVGGSVGPALVIGFALGVAALRKPRLHGPLFAILNLLQTIPSIALFGLLIAPLSALAGAAPWLASLGVGGIGPAPAIIALILYALLPIARSTVAGLAGVDPAVLDAASGMGLTARQIFLGIELPLALPVLLAGLRIVVVETIGLAVIAALIGAGGLGTFVFEGLGQYALDLVLLGALPAIFLALAADFGLRILSDLLPARVTG